MGRQSKEFQAFDSLMGKLLTVPKSTIHERHAEHKRKAALNPRKRGPKAKPKPCVLGRLAVSVQLLGEVMPIEGRDDEFRATIRFYFFKLVGHAPDEAQMAAYLTACRNGWTGEDINNALAKEPEAIAYANKPKPRVPHLEGRGRDFVNQHGERIALNGCDGFLDFRIYRDGGEAALRPFMDEGRDLRFNLRRVFFMGDKSENQVMDLNPREPGYYDDVRSFIDYENAHGFIVLATIGVDNQKVGMGYDHWQRMADLMRGSATIYSGGNEYTKNGFERRLVPDPGMIFSRGSDQQNGLPDPNASAMEFHQVRNMPTSIRDAVASATEIYDVLHFPNIPLIMDEPAKFGTNGSGPEFLEPRTSYNFARFYATLWAAAVFHNWFGQRGRLMDAQTRACAEAWTKGMQL